MKSMCFFLFLSVQFTSLGGLDLKTFQELHFMYMFTNCVCEQTSSSLHSLCSVGHYQCRHRELIFMSFICPINMLIRVSKSSPKQKLLISFEFRCCQHGRFYLLAILCQSESTSLVSSMQYRSSLCFSSISLFPHFIVHSFPASECNLHQLCVCLLIKLVGVIV